MNDFVMVPRQLLKDVLSVDVPKTKEALDSFRKILEQPVEQNQGEPVALRHVAVSEFGQLRWMNGRQMVECELYAMPDGTAIRQPLYTRKSPSETQLKAAKTISDEMMDLVDRLGSEANEVDSRAWEHLLVYAPRRDNTHADPCEVERLRDELKASREIGVSDQRTIQNLVMERDPLRAQLAEAHALLREFCERVERGEVRSKTTYAKFKAALSASAEQSAPVEHDERAEFLKWANKEYEVGEGYELNESNVDVVQNRKGWMARAALERKP